MIRLAIDSATTSGIAIYDGESVITYDTKGTPIEQGEHFLSIVTADRSGDVEVYIEDVYVGSNRHTLIVLAKRLGFIENLLSMYGYKVTIISPNTYRKLLSTAKTKEDYLNYWQSRSKSKLTNNMSDALTLLYWGAALDINTPFVRRQV